MEAFKPFNYGNVLAQSEDINNSRLRRQIMQNEQDPNSINNQLLREQLAGTRQTNQVNNALAKRNEIKFSQEQQLENTRILNAGFAQMMQDPSSAPDITAQFKEMGIFKPGFDISTMPPDQIREKAKQGYDATKAALVAYDGGSSDKSGILALAPGSTVYDSKNKRVLYTNPPIEKPQKMSSTMEKELIESDDIAVKSQNVISMLDEALSLNSKAYSGYGAKARSEIRSNLPGQSEAADATVNLDNIMTGQALESLKAVFGGMPTEGERRILLDMQASVSKTPEQRKAIIERAKVAAKRRIEFNKKKASAIRSGTYLSEGVQEQSAPAAKTNTVKYDPATGKWSDQ